jgi:prevent-host-death family protein
MKKIAGTKTVGAYEAKTHLPALLKEVARGGEIVITRREKPVARLVPITPVPSVSRKELVARMRAFRKTHRLPKGETVRDLIEAGRRI